MLDIVLVIAVLAFIVLVHELGHFLVAKWSNIDVPEFGIGLPPRIWGKKFGNTLYSLNWIPFGGFVRIAGDDEDAVPDQAEIPNTRGFKDKSFFTKTSVMVGGVVANVYLAFVFLAFAFWFGLPVSVDSFPDVPMRDTWVAITGTVEGSPAARVGFILPARVEAISAGDTKVDVLNEFDIINAVRGTRGTNVTIYIKEQGGLIKSFTVTPTVSGDNPFPSIGANLDLVGVGDYGLLAAFGQAYTFSGKIIVDTARGIVSLLIRSLSGTASLDGVSGPIGIAGILGDARSEGVGPFLFIVVIISMSLAVINFVPFPALDGGRFLFLLIEAVLRRPIKPIISRTVNLVGFMLLLLLMVFVTYHDIARMW